MVIIFFVVKMILLQEDNYIPSNSGNIPSKNPENPNEFFMGAAGKNVFMITPEDRKIQKVVIMKLQYVMEFIHDMEEKTSALGKSDPFANMSQQQKVLMCATVAASIPRNEGIEMLMLCSEGLVQVEKVAICSSVLDKPRLPRDWDVSGYVVHIPHLPLYS